MVEVVLFKAVGVKLLGSALGLSQPEDFCLSVEKKKRTFTKKHLLSYFCFKGKEFGKFERKSDTIFLCSMKICLELTQS